MSAILKPPFAEKSRPVPRLEQGDHLSAQEFERRFDAMPELKKAELVEGVVCMGSPVRIDYHGEPHFDLNGWLWTYRRKTPGVRGGDNATVRFDENNVLQPDGFLFIGRGGQTRISEDNYVEGPPELAAEISTSTVSFDLHAKKRVYQQHGVKEYLVWRVADKAIDWFRLQNGEFTILPLHVDGYYESEVFPGLRLDPVAFLRSDFDTVIKVLQDGLASPAHADFVARLQAN